MANPSLRVGLSQTTILGALGRRSKRKCCEQPGHTLCQIRNLGVVTPVLVEGKAFPLDVLASARK